MVTPGVIAKILQGISDSQPILKVGAVKGIMPNNETTPQRYRLSLVDGQDSVQTMLGTQLNGLIVDGSLAIGSIIKLTEFTVNELHGQKIIVVLNLDVVGKDDQYSGMPDSASTSDFKAAPVTTASSHSAGNHVHGIAEMKASSPYASMTSGARNNRPVARNSHGDEGVLPISALNPYSNRWKIKARITSKSEIRRWSNARGEGTLFSIDLLDSKGGEIRATFFKDSCEKWYPQLEEQKVYTFSGGRLKVGDRKYSTIKNEYELTFDANSEIQHCPDDNEIKTMNYNFIKISELPQVEVNSTVDVLAIVRSAGECTELVSQKLGGKILHKRELVLYDDTGYEVRLTLWGDKAQADTPWSDGPIVAFKGVGVGDYGGRTLSVRQSSSMAINPELDEAFQLYQWRVNGGDAQPANSLSGSGGGNGGSVAFDQRNTLASIKDDALGMAEKPDYITLKGAVTYVRHDNEPWYAACPNAGCNKKVLEGGLNHSWTCERCNQDFPNCIRRYILSLTMSDHSGQFWLSLFNDTAEKLLGVSAEHLHEAKVVNGDERRYEEVFQNVLFKTFVAKVRVKQESVNDELRVKATVVNLDRVDYASESRQLIDAISRY